METLMSETMKKAIDNIESIISVMITDMSIGASYVRSNSTSCLDMIMLKKELEARLPNTAMAKKK